MLRSLKILTFFACLCMLSSSCVRKTDVVALREKNALDDLEALYLNSWQPPTIYEPLTLQDAIEIALANNLDVYAQEYEREAQARLANAIYLRMIPPLTIDGVYSYRSKPLSSFSKIIVPEGQPIPITSPFPQVSSSQTTFQWSLRDSLNLLDLGIAYFRTRQEKNQTLVVSQQHIRARQKLILDVTQAYWKAIASKQTLQDISQVIELSKGFQEAIALQATRRVLPVLQALDSQAHLLEQQIQLEGIRFQYESSKMELAGLMGLLPGTIFEIEDKRVCSNEIEFENLRQLEEEALRMRPELAVKDLQEKIAIDKIRQNILLVFPNTLLYADENYDANPFLVHHYWWSAGIRATWNLFSIPQQWQSMRSAEGERAFAYFSRLALSVAVISQVHIAYINYRDTLNQYRLANQAYLLRSRLAETAEKVRRSGEFHGAATLNFVIDALLAKVNAWKAYSNLQIAQEQLNYAIGRPLYFGPQDEEEL